MSLPYQQFYSSIMISHGNYTLKIWLCRVGSWHRDWFGFGIGAGGGFGLRLVRGLCFVERVSCMFVGSRVLDSCLSRLCFAFSSPVFLAFLIRKIDLNPKVHYFSKHFNYCPEPIQIYWFWLPKFSKMDHTPHFLSSLTMKCPSNYFLTVPLSWYLRWRSSFDHLSRWVLFRSVWIVRLNLGIWGYGCTWDCVCAHYWLKHLDRLICL